MRGGPTIRPLLLTLLVAGGCSELPLGASDRRDYTPPVLDVRAPLRGTIAGGETEVEVRGFASDEGAGIEALTVNGKRVEVAANGAFSTRVALLPGITLLDLRLTDRALNEQAETRAVLSGNLVPLETTVKDGVVVRLDRELLRVAAEVAARKVNALDLKTKLMNRNPLVSGGIKCASARVEITDVAKGAASFSLLPVAGGLALDTSIVDLRVAVHVKYDVACHSGEGDIVITARRFRLAGTLGLSVDAQGRAALDASQTSAAFEGFDWGGDLLPASVRDFLEEPLAETLAFVLADELRKRLPELVADQLGGKEQVINVGDRELLVSLRPSLIRVDERGVLMALDSRILVYGSVGAVFPQRTGARPDLDQSARALGVGISEDALNQALSSLWGAGVLDREQSVPTERFQKYGLVFNHLTIGFRLPPVAEALPGGGGLRITLGDVECNFEMRQPGRAPIFVGRLAVSLRGTFRGGVVDNKIALVPDRPELSIDVLPDKGQLPHTFNEDSLRALSDYVSEVLAGVLGDSVSDVPIPSIEGLRVVAGEVGSAAAGGYLLVRGDVAAL